MALVPSSAASALSLQLARSAAISRSVTRAATSVAIPNVATALAGFAQNPAMKAITLKDSASNYLQNFEALKAMANAGKIAGIQFLDKGKPGIQLNADHFSGHSATALVAKLTSASVTLKDSAANIQRNFSAIAPSSARIASVTLSVAGDGSVTDTSRPLITISASQYKTGAALLAKLKDASLAVSFSGSRNQYRAVYNTDGSITTTDLNKRVDESNSFKGVRFLKFSDMTTFVSSGDTNVDALLSPGSTTWWYAGVGAQSSATPIKAGVYELAAGSARTTISYSFMSGTAPAGASVEDRTGFTAMNSTQKQAVRDAFSYLSSLINVSFVESGASNGSADINFAMNSQSGSAGYANLPNASGPHNSFVMLNKDTPTNNSFAQGGYGWHSLIHEIGHAMGLKHPGNYNAGGGGTAPPYLSATMDSNRNTVMSYKPIADGGVVTETVSGSMVSSSASTLNPSTYMPLDIAALQFLYGANTSPSGGLDSFQTLSFTDSWKGFETIWAPNGVTLNASTTSRSNIIDMRAGAFSSIGAQASTTAALANFSNKVYAAKYNTYLGYNNVALAYGSRYNAVTGGSAADIIYAGTTSASVNGGAGNDVLYLNGAATDWDFGNLSRGVAGRDGSMTVSGSATLTHKTISGLSLSVSNIEKIKFYNAATAVTTHKSTDLLA